MDWTVHWLEAEGPLAPWREAITAEIAAAREAVGRLVPVPRLDILVQRLPAGVIPETGTGGMAYRPSLFSLTIDPDNPNFAAGLAGGDLRRTVAHEVHHCLRMGGPGYGRTLGEALVSEGLAGHFVGHAFGSPPEPWERAVDEAALVRHRPEAAALDAAPYDHAGWFFGAGGRLPRWLGYTLGHRIVGEWLAATPGVAGPTWYAVPARDVLAASALLRPATG